MNIKDIFTSYSNPKDNADTQRVVRTIKEDLAWPNEFLTVEALTEALARWLHFYNHDCPQSVLDYANPGEYERRAA